MVAKCLVGFGLVDFVVFSLDLVLHCFRWVLRYSVLFMVCVYCLMIVFD